MSKQSFPNPEILHISFVLGKVSLIKIFREFLELFRISEIRKSSSPKLLFSKLINNKFL